jgi:uncharacterized protein YutE (UPF0331/DUF86 family)
MSPGPISAVVVTDRAAWVRRMLAGIRSLPVGDAKEFAATPSTVAAAESYLRRALEALLDLGRHVLAKGFGRGVAEYKAIASALHDEGVLTAADAEVLIRLAGFRNRMVHFYHAIGDEELRLICRDQLGDIDQLLDALLGWLRSDPSRVDREI